MDSNLQNQLTVDLSLSLCKVSVQALRAICDPFENCPWQNKVSLDSVEYALRNQLFVTGPIFTKAELQFLNANGSDTDSARVAYFVKYGWDDPISVDVGVPAVGYEPEWPILDGNHRFAAAIYSGSEYIKAEVSGQVDFAIEKLHIQGTKNGQI